MLFLGVMFLWRCLLKIFFAFFMRVVAKCATMLTKMSEQYAWFVPISQLDHRHFEISLSYLVHLVAQMSFTNKRSAGTWVLHRKIVFLQMLRYALAHMRRFLGLTWTGLFLRDNWFVTKRFLITFFFFLHSLIIFEISHFVSQRRLLTVETLIHKLIILQ